MAALVDLAGLQLDSLPAAVPGEEDQLRVDASASAARAARHELALRTATPAPNYADRPAWSAFCRDFFDELGLANFSGVEIVAVHARQTRSGVKNRLPNAWGILRLGLVVIRMQRLRDEVGALRPTSLCRIPEYNIAIGGASKGQHPACTAADTVPLQASIPDLWNAIYELRNERIKLTADQVAAFCRFREATGYTGGVMTGPVYREPWSPGVKFDGQAFTSVGGRGAYPSFCHSDLRGYEAAWRG